MMTETSEHTQQQMRAQTHARTDVDPATPATEFASMPIEHIGDRKPAHKAPKIDEAKRPLRKNILGVLPQAESFAIHIHQERCAKVRNRNVECAKCAKACTSGCIHLEGGMLRVDASKCVGCGTCATVCPTCAIESRNPSDSELLEQCLQARKGNTVVITCHQVACALSGFLDSDHVAEVVCMGRVEESLLALLAIRGVESIILACGNCDMCEQRQGLSTARMVEENANVLLETWQSKTRAHVTNHLVDDLLDEAVQKDSASKTAAQQAWKTYFSKPCGNKPIRPDAQQAAPSTTTADTAGDTSADANSDDAGASGETVAAEAPKQPAQPEVFFAPLKTAPRPNAALMRVMKDGTLPHFIPDRRERLLDALDQLGTPHREKIRCRLWGTIAIDATKCTSCRMCATFCPTGAIEKFDNPDGTFGVDHYPSRCVKCGTCRDICRHNAVMILDDVRTDFLVKGLRHHYVMKERPVKLGDSQQILNAMRYRMPGTNLFER